MSALACNPLAVVADKICAARMMGPSMDPAIGEGYLVYFDATKPVDGDLCLIQRFDDDGYVVGRLTLTRRDAYEIFQYNPPRLYEIPKSEVSAIHKVLGWYCKE